MLRLKGAIYSPIGSKIEKSFEKDFSVRILCRTLAQSIPEGLENKMALGAKIKKNTKTFFKGNLAARNFWRRIPLMQNFFEKSLADTENIISHYLAYGLKELAIFFKPINILIN